MASPAVAPLAGQHPKNQQIFGDPVGWHVISINLPLFIIVDIVYKYPENQASLEASQVASIWANPSSGLI